MWHGLSGRFDLILFHQGKSVDWKKGKKAVFLEQHTSSIVSLISVADSQSAWQGDYLYTLKNENCPVVI